MVRSNGGDILRHRVHGEEKRREEKRVKEKEIKHVVTSDMDWKKEDAEQWRADIS